MCSYNLKFLGKRFSVTKMSLPCPRTPFLPVSLPSSLSSGRGIRRRQAASPPHRSRQRRHPGTRAADDPHKLSWAGCWLPSTHPRPAPSALLCKGGSLLSSISGGSLLWSAQRPPGASSEAQPPRSTVAAFQDGPHQQGGGCSPSLAHPNPACWESILPPLRDSSRSRPALPQKPLWAGRRQASAEVSEGPTTGTLHCQGPPSTSTTKIKLLEK